MGQQTGWVHAQRAVGLHYLPGGRHVNVRVRQLVLPRAADRSLFALVERPAHLVVAARVLSWQALPQQVYLL